MADQRPTAANTTASDPSCAVAHGEEPGSAAVDRELVAVDATGVSEVLLRWGRELGFRTRLLEPDLGRPHAAPTRPRPE
jgi:xanthine dehydrogenase accessory factor